MYLAASSAVGEVAMLKMSCAEALAVRPAHRSDCSILCADRITFNPANLSLGI